MTSLSQSGDLLYNTKSEKCDRLAGSCSRDRRPATTGSGIYLYECKLPGPIPHVLVREGEFRTAVPEMGAFQITKLRIRASDVGKEGLLILRFLAAV